jgi:hypothetical protein
LLCTTRAPPPSSAKGDCEAENLRARWCEGQLAECERSTEAVRHDWPEQDTVEDPARWVDAVEAGLAECAIEGAELEVIDCAEYPCVAALRPAVDGGPDSESFRQEQERLIEAVRGCGPLRAAFGIEDESQHKALDVFSNDTTCPDGSRADFFAFMALDPDGEAFDLLDDDNEKRSKRQERDLFRWLFRRGDDIAAQYPCDG